MIREEQDNLFINLQLVTHPTLQLNVPQSPETHLRIRGQKKELLLDKLLKTEIHL